MTISPPILSMNFIRSENGKIDIIFITNESEKDINDICDILESIQNPDIFKGIINDALEKQISSKQTPQNYKDNLTCILDAFNSENNRFEDELPVVSATRVLH